MFSGLSRGTTRAPEYDQAARNVACLARALAVNRRPLTSHRSLGFWVLAPEKQISADIFACVCRESVEQKIRPRIEQYDMTWRRRRGAASIPRGRTAKRSPLARAVRARVHPRWRYGHTPLTHRG
jgi:hypothetical protein